MNDNYQKIVILPGFPSFLFLFFKSRQEVHFVQTSLCGFWQMREGTIWKDRFGLGSLHNIFFSDFSLRKPRATRNFFPSSYPNWTVANTNLDDLFLSSNWLRWWRKKTRSRLDIRKMGKFPRGDWSASSKAIGYFRCQLTFEDSGRARKNAWQFKTIKIQYFQHNCVLGRS